MKTVTDDFLSAQIQKSSDVVRIVEYKRRYWNQSTNSYTWESSWTELNPKYIVQISPINWQLDSETLTEFKVSNVTLVLDNTNNYFGSENPSGFFGQDSNSPFYPYEPFWTKFRIRSGYVLEDGTEELLTMFSGLSDGEFLMDSESKTVQVVVQGLENLLINTNAEDIATTVSAETIGTGDTSTVDFTTTNPGVGGVTLVTVDGITQTEGVDYTVSQLNDATLGAKVSFTLAPDTAEAIKCDYFYWPQNTGFDSIIASLLDQAGIPSGDQFIQPVNFENEVINTNTFDSKSQWDTGNFDAMQSSSNPGGILVDWLADAMKQSTTWSTTKTGWTNGASGANITSDGTYLVSTNNADGIIYRSQTSNYGIWEFGLTFDGDIGNSAVAWIMTNSTDSGIPINGYRLMIEHISGPKRIISLDRVGGLLDTPVGLGSDEITLTSSEQTFSISVAKTGQIRVFVDGILVIDSVDNAIKTGVYFGLSLNSSSTKTTKVRNIDIPSDQEFAFWTTNTIDAGSTPTSWVPMLVGLTYDETIAIQTRTSDDDISYDAWLGTNFQNIPTSTLRRYIQLRVRIDLANVLVTRDPIVDLMVLRYKTTSVNVTLPAFTDYNVYEAIQSMGKFAIYEFGFTPDEDFFFRPKTPGQSVFNLTQSDFIAHVSSLTNGYQKTVGLVRATYGSITKEITVSNDFPSSPSAKVKAKVFEITTDTAIQIPASADVASGVAEGLFKILSRPRKKFKLNTKYLPQLDIADVVSVRLINDTNGKLWYLGDPSVDFGDEDVNLWGKSNQILFDNECKIVSARYDTERHSCEFDLEEV